MKIISNNYENIKNSEPITLTIGNFDGLHLGHQKLIEKVISFKDTKSAVMSFSPHPINFFNPNQNFYTIMSNQIKEDTLKKFNLDYYFKINFDLKFSSLSVLKMIEFLKSLNVKRLVLGEDFKFSKGGVGSTLDLEDDFEVVVLKDVLLNEVRVSSTVIKEELKRGSLKTAEKFLGRKYSIIGFVEDGSKIGTLLGFKTANINYGNFILPKDGVYYTKVIFNNKTYQGMANIGHNPSVNYQKVKRLEVNIFDFDENLYNKEIEIIFLEYIRPEMKFNSKEELIEQLNKDKNYILSLSN